MVLGFNHNVVYKGEVFHVQTEDSGVSNPHIITLLYKGGVILCSKKTSYADIVKMDNLDAVVEELMKEQHKELMRRLKAGEFDEKAFAAQAAAPTVKVSEAPEGPAGGPVEDIFSASSPERQPASKSDISLLFDLPAPTKPASQQHQQSNTPAAKEVVSLDDAILNFFGANEK